MWGKPFDALKQAMTNVGNIVFKDEDESLFENVDLVFYNLELDPK